MVLPPFLAGTGSLAGLRGGHENRAMSGHRRIKPLSVNRSFLVL